MQYFSSVLFSFYYEHAVCALFMKRIEVLLFIEVYTEMDVIFSACFIKFAI